MNIKRTTSWQRGHKQSARASNKASGEVASRLLSATAHLLVEILPAESRVAMRQVSAAVKVALSVPPSPTAELPCVRFTHEGGLGGQGKENQDASFVGRPSADVTVFAVLDGHGKQYGRLAAQTAARCMKTFLCGHHRWLLAEPEECLRLAFREAHFAIRAAILRSDPMLRLHQSGQAPPYILQWMATDQDEHGEPVYKWDAVDGGTTVTVVVVLRGENAIVATVGDSAAVLLSRDGTGMRQSEQLVAEHSPTNLAEYVRMRAVATGKVKFVYDCPDFEEFSIFCEDTHGNTKLDLNSQRLADEHEVMFKNGRDDRFTLVVIPEEEISLGELAGVPSAAGAAQKTLVEEQMITMTRSLGDFFPHRYGVTWEPELRVLPLASVGKNCTWPLLLLASDGIWDIWDFDEVSDRLVAPAASRPQSADQLRLRADTFFEETRRKGNDYFGEAADNLTGILVDLAAAVARLKK